MNNKIKSNIYQSSVIKNTEAQLFSYWREISLPNFLLDKTEISSDEFKAVFLDKEFSPIKIYFTSLLIDIIYVSELVDENDDEELFEYWEQSEFTSLFLTENEKDESSTVLASQKALESLTLHFIDYFRLCFIDNTDCPYTIKPLPEIGDYSNWIYLGKNKGLELSSSNSKTNNTDFLIINSFDKIKDAPQRVIQHKTNSLTLRPGSKEGNDKIKEFEDKIIKSLDILSELAPELYDTFFNFTHTIIALNEPSMVSYSLQSLPGYSSINLYNRDLVDCIDDLIHENGHHYLNTILNSQDLLSEPPEKDYFSPWRMTPRPIRGIYHGTFTFFWALELFGQLSVNEKSYSIFSEEEMEKIKFRYIEEFYKLEYCWTPLNKAQSNDLISKEGWDLICDVLKLVRSHHSNIDVIFNSLSEASKISIIEMTESLEK